MSAKEHLILHYLMLIVSLGNLVSSGARRSFWRFFPGAFTSVCSKEMCAFRDSLTRLSELKPQVVGVSVNDPFSNKGFAERNLLTFPLLSDYTREVVGLYGIELKDFAGLKGYSVTTRSVFIIDKDGFVRCRWVSEDPRVEPNYQEIENVLGQTMQKLVEPRNNEVCSVLP